MSWLDRILHWRKLNSAEPTVSSLRSSDRKRDVFGASRHNYDGFPVSRASLCLLEARCGVGLPATYIHHLSTIGFVVGPYYGLSSPEDVVVELARFVPASPFRFSAEDFHATGETKNPPSQTCDFPVHGCIPIGDQGCGHQSLLVVCGPHQGSVWDLIEGEISPARRPAGFVIRPRITLPPLPIPPTFTEWYVGWIEQAVADLNQ